MARKIPAAFKANQFKKGKGKKGSKKKATKSLPAFLRRKPGK